MGTLLPTPSSATTNPNCLVSQDSLPTTRLDSRCSLQEQFEEANSYFEPPERLDQGSILQQVEIFHRSDRIYWVLNSLPDMTVVLNEQRQIVFINDSLLHFVGARDAESVYGKRPGEALGCLHSHLTEQGCGTTPFCKGCGAAQAILASQRHHAKSIKECHLIREDGDALDLRVFAAPYEENGAHFTLFTIVDISHENRRKALERIFFHDILNTAGGLQGLAEFMAGDAESAANPNLAGMVADLSKSLVDEIKAQQILLHAEHNELTPQSLPIQAKALLEQLLRIYQAHDITRLKELRLLSCGEDCELLSDPVILQRIVGNMLKNAIEASHHGSSVEVGCRKTAANEVTFWVRNANCMRPDVSMKVFKRSFSTKGKGRGLGTYSMKLLGERYLKGKVTFTSDEERGTIFSITLPLARA